MKLELRSQGVRLTQELRQYIERKLAFALGRFGGHVRRVHVHLSDINGPRGGEDIRCRIRASLGPGGDLTIEETREDSFAAVARASARVRQNFARNLDRLSSRRRGR